MDVKEILHKYRDKCRNGQLSDEYLEEHKCKARTDIPIAVEFPYGIVYLQDAAVDVLIKRIEDLETELQKLRGTIKAMEEWEHRVDKAR